MRRILWLALLTGVVALQGSAFAESLRPNTQKVKGGLITSGSNVSGETLVSGSAELITGVVVACGSSACNLGLFDNASASGASSTETSSQLVFDIGAAANTTAYVNLKDVPVRVLTGIHAVLTGSGNGAVVYTEQNN